MNMKLSYPREKFARAVSNLAASPESLKKRIMSAYMSFHPIKSSDFSEFPELQSQWQMIYDGLTAKEAVGDEGKVQATLNEFTEDEAIDMADKIVNLYFEIASSYRD